MQKVHVCPSSIEDLDRRRRAASVEALMALRSRLAGIVEIELLTPAQAFACRRIVVAEPVGLVEGWRVMLAWIAADADGRTYQSASPGKADTEAWARLRVYAGR